MELAAPCTICKLKSPCDCKNLMARYLSILENVHYRILSQKLTSKPQEFLKVSAGIDKLDAYFLEPVDLSTVIAHARQNGLETKKEQKNKRVMLKVANNNSSIWLSLNITQELATGIISNPNRFENWYSYLAFIKNAAPLSIIENAKITRLDLNLDFNLPFEELIQKIDIKQKSTNISYDDKGGVRTGIYIGKEPEMILIYNKSKKEKLPSPLTRVELRLRGNKLPCKSIYNVAHEIQSKSFFSSCVGCDLTYEESTLSHPQKNKLQDFTSLLKRDGLYSARKIMNKTRNFDRDVAKILQTTLWATQPTELFKREIKSFLGVEN